MKILITGGSGFIGSNVAEAYLSAGHEVVVADNLSSDSAACLPSDVRLYPISIESPDFGNLLKLEQPDVINHHAAQKSVPMSVENPMLDARINALGLLNVLEAAVQHNVRKIIYISSGGALAGDAPVIPTDESYIPKMISPYAIHKYLGEQYLHFYSVTHGLEYTVLRYANVYGPRQIADGECGVVPIFMNNLLSNQPCTLFAYANQPRGTTRDYVYVKDVCAANVAALTKANQAVLNIGTGIEVDTETVYEELAQLIGRELPLIRRPERVGDVQRSALDCRKAAELLDWKPTTPLRDGLRETLAWLEDSRRKPSAEAHR
ncbi:NAD-dependent epimerase/dehydratase family protein [Alicyclobacillus sp. SP_1]|uniref:NAD-dependent epimerase/dehydratase family protein n=1 Tax=Alicyclobacillus sp. SP_1 TaxID=2942475 RepID=UPI002158691A|nr:NAD-dependent epimerase/dehydratase family protein [Alicyclobacillus sp. SP_1]